MADADLYQTEFLFLVNQLTRQIVNHLGINNKTRAELVIKLYERSNRSPDSFKANLAEAGVFFDDTLVKNVMGLIIYLHPKYKNLKREKLERSAEAFRKLKASGGEISDWRRQSHMFHAPAGEDKQVPPAVPDDMEPGDLVAGKGTQVQPRVEEPSPKRQRRDHSGKRKEGSRHQLDDEPVLFKIYTGKVSSIKDFGAFVTLEGVAGRAEGLVYVSDIQAGARAGSAAHLLRGQTVKVKVTSLSVDGRIGLSMKEVDQATGRDLTPHLRIESEAEMEEEHNYAAHASSSANEVPLRIKADAPQAIRSALKRLTSPELWEIKQLISSDAIRASEYRELDEDFNNPMAHAEVKRN